MAGIDFNKALWWRKTSIGAEKTLLELDKSKEISDVIEETASWTETANECLDGESIIIVCQKKVRHEPQDAGDELRGIDFVETEARMAIYESRNDEET